MKKRICSIALALCMVFSLLPTVAFATEATTVTLTVDFSAENDDASRAEGATYKTLAGAITAAESGDTLQLATAIDLGTNGVTITNKSLTLDLHGNTITFKKIDGKAITLENAASLTLQDTVGGGKLSATDGGGIENTSTGTVTIASGTVECTVNGTALGNSSTGAVIIAGGTVQNTLNGETIFNSSTGAVTVTGGTVTSSGPIAVSNNEAGSITVSGGNVKSIHKGTGTLRNSEGYNVYLATLTEPENNRGKSFVIQMVRQMPYPYDLTASTHIGNKWYVWLPDGEAKAEYDGKRYTTTVTTAGTAEFAPTYEVGVDVPDLALTLPSATVGYGDQAAKSITVSNDPVYQPTGDLTVALSGTNADSFTLSRNSITGIEPGGSTTFTVAPKTGLAVGTYTATVTLSNSNISKSFTVSFTVSPVAPNTYAVTISDGGTGATGAGSYASGASVSINAGSKSGYTFSGWTSADVTFADPSSAATSFTMPDKAVTVTANWTYNGGGDGGSSSGGSSTPSTPGASATVDGKTADLGKTETRGDTTTAILDQTKLNKSLESAKSGGTLTVPVTTTKDSAAVELTAESVAKMAEKDMTLEVKSGKTSYTLPVNAMDTKDILTQLGATDASKVAVTITITNEKSTTVPGEKLVGTPVSFTVSAAYGGKTVAIGRFTSLVSRTIEITKAQAEVLSTAVVLEKGGDLRHVPTRIFTQGGKWYATFSSMTNSTYALIERAASFTDVTGQWYADAANELASRAITKGVFDTSFQGEKAITRAEFAALLVNAFGLPKDAKADFSDMTSDAWYSQAVATASAYGIANGIGGGKFSPDATITRQQAMVMIHRAATIVGYTGGGTDTGTFTDRAEVGAWAAEGVAFNLANGLIVGNDGKINPNDTITRAQTATVLLRLLQKAELVDVRTEA